MQILKKLNVYRGLPKSMYIIFFVQVINRFGDFVFPFLTSYLTSKLGVSYEITGIVVMLGAVLNIPGSLVGGRLADKVGRRKTYIIFQTSAALCFVPCAFINRQSIIIFLLLMSTFFNSAVRAPLSAIITDILPPEKRQIGFSLQYLGINIGVAIGPIVAGFLLDKCIPMLFLGDALTSFIAVALLSMNIKESGQVTVKKEIVTAKEDAKEEIASSEEKTEKGNIFQVMAKRPQIVVFLIIYSIYCFVYTQHRFSLPLTLDNIFLSEGVKKFGLLMSVNAVTVLVLTVFVTNVTKKFKAITNIIIAGVLYAIGFGMLGIVNSFPLFIVSTILWTIGEILTATNFGVYLANNSPSNYRARFSAIGGVSWAVGGALGTSLMGGYITIKGINSAWGLTFILACIATILMIILDIYSMKKNRSA